MIKTGAQYLEDMKRLKPNIYMMGENVEIGMSVKAVFADKTTNTILDIDHFAPIEE